MVQIQNGKHVLLFEDHVGYTTPTRQDARRSYKSAVNLSALEDLDHEM